MSLKTYYLQQMGIETWVRRTLLPRASGVHIIAPQHTDSLALIVFEGGELDKVNQWIGGAEGRLLKNMLLSIGLSSENTVLVFGETSSMEAVVLSQVIHLKPRVILVLKQASSACDAIRFTSSNSSPIVNCIHPMDLLSQPLRKKLAYADLWRVKTMLCVDQFEIS